MDSMRLLLLVYTHAYLSHCFAVLHHHCITCDHQQNVVDLTDSEAKEQDTVDEHDNLVTELSKHKLTIAQRLGATPRKVATRRLVHVRKALQDVFVAIGTLSEDTDNAHRLHQYEDQLIDLSRDLSETRNTLLTLDLVTYLPRSSCSTL